MYKTSSSYFKLNNVLSVFYIYIYTFENDTSIFKFNNLNNYF